MNDYLLSFGGYDWLWKNDKDEAYDEFMSKNPSLDDYEAQLKTFSATEDEIGRTFLFDLFNLYGTLRFLKSPFQLAEPVARRRR